MKTTNRIFPVLAVLLCVSLGCSFFKSRNGNSPYGVKDSDILPTPPIDANSEFPALSTDAINALVIESPELAKHRDKILDLERAAIKGLLVIDQSKTKAAKIDAYSSLNATYSRVIRHKSIDGFFGALNLIPAAYAATDAPSLPDMGGIEFFLAGYQVGFLTPDFEKARTEDLGKSKTNETKDDSGTVLAAQTISVNGDGTVSSEITTNINMPVLGLKAKSRVKITGNQCPTSDGRIDLTIELGTDGRSGSAGSVIYDKSLTGKVMATVNDDAELAGFDIDIKQATRSTAGGRQIYIETGQTIHSAKGTYSGMDFSDPNIIRTSSQATQADQTLSNKGLLQAFLLAQGILESARGRWQDGGCVKIDATSPGSVNINSTNQIPVKVISKVDGTEVPSKLETKLTGGTSIDPAVIPKTSGTLTYVAPGEAGKTATISLTATSRQGKATLELAASTGGNSYHITGGLDDFQTSADVCDVTKPFTLEGGGFTVQFSGGMEGTYNYNGPYNAKGEGTYKISLPDGPGKPGTMVGGGAGEITGDKVYTGSGVEKYTLTPIEPCRP